MDLVGLVGVVGLVGLMSLLGLVGLVGLVCQVKRRYFNKRPSISSVYGLLVKFIFIRTHLRLAYVDKFAIWNNTLLGSYIVSLISQKRLLSNLMK